MSRADAAAQVRGPVREDVRTRALVIGHDHVAGIEHLGQALVDRVYGLT